MKAETFTTLIGQEFKSRFGNSPAVYSRAPGRINIIGEHTDYNQGFVLPGAINNSIYVALAKNNLSKVRSYAYDYSEYQEVGLSYNAISGNWINYVFGSIKESQFRRTGLEGVDVVFGGDIPAGAGLSSSAALTCGIATGMNQLFELNLSPKKIALIGQAVEHKYVGMQCGIMDQFASVFGQPGQVIRLDCRNLDFEYYNLDLPDASILLCDSGVKHSLASSEYNVRRKECEEGAEILSKHFPQVQSLRDVLPEMLEHSKGVLRPNVFNRCKYVVDENERVQQACEALKRGNNIKLGKLMFETHRGLRDLYEVSCPEIDLLVDIAHGSTAALGSRMMGGGFGGCTINLVRTEGLESFQAEAERAYRDTYQRDLKVYKVELGMGASILESI